MSKRKINLNEIIENSIKNENLNGLNDLLLLISSDKHKSIVKKSMLEFGKQLLELAYENAIIIDDPNSYCGNTGSEYSPDQIISEQSILDTIKQVE